MDRELRAYLALTRRLPRVKGAGVVANVLKRAYARKPRDPVEADVQGFRMRLEPNEAVDREVLFAPQLYDRAQVDFMLARLRPGDTFLDVGANIGIYTLLASRGVGPTGRVIAIEADPYNVRKLEENLAANDARNVTLLPMGVSDKDETLKLRQGAPGNRGGSTFALDRAGATVDVPCHPLLDLLQRERVERVAAMKMDIEGFEFRVMRRFFDEAPRALWPRFAIMEQHPGEEFRRSAGGEVVALMQEKGYRLAWHKDGDYVLTL